MSLVSLPNVRKIPKMTRNPLYIQNGMMFEPILNCENLGDIRYTERKPDNMKSDFAIVATFLANVEDIRLIQDTKVGRTMWWGFMRGCGRLYMHSHAKHDRPTYFT